METAIQQKTPFLNTLTSPERFQLLDDGWIRDNLLGVEWGPSSDEVMDFKKAEKYCADKGGRLPEIQELSSLINYKKDEPAAYEIFKDTKTDDWYWSGTKAAWRTDAAWCVDFDYGSVSSIGVGSDNYVRPVRPCQC